MNRFEYVRPRTWSAALQALSKKESNAAVQAGGVDLWDRMKEGLDAPDRIVSLLGIRGGGSIVARRGRTVSIGALVTLSQIARHRTLGEWFSALTDAAGQAANPNIREAATLGGNLCQRPRCAYFRSQSHPCLRKGGDTCFALDGDNRMHGLFDNERCAAVLPSSLAVVLASLDAQVEVVRLGGTVRKIDIGSFYVPASKDLTREVALEPGELVRRVVIGSEAWSWRSAYGKVRVRQSFDWPLVEGCVAIRRDGDRVVDARVILGAVAMSPWRARHSEAILRDATVSSINVDEVGAAAVVGANALSHNGYKTRVVAALIARLCTRVQVGTHEK